MRVFLSYSRTDRDHVDRFDRDLGRADIEVWRDAKGLRGGEVWRTQIIDAIEQSDVFLLFVSPASMHSDNVRRELTVAEEDHKRIVPVLLAATTIPDNFRYSLAGVQYTDITGMEYDDALAAIRDSLISSSVTQRLSPPRPSPPRDATRTAPARKPPFRSIGIAVVVIGVMMAVVASLLRGGSKEPSNSGPGGVSAASSASNQRATVNVNRRFGYGAFAISLGKAIFSDHTLSIDAVFENLASTDFQIDPNHLTVVYAGNAYGSSGDPVPKVAGNARASGTLVFSVFGPFDLKDAVLVAGRGEQNQAIVPLGGQGQAHLLEPRAEHVRGQATAATLTVKIEGGVVAAGNFGFDAQASKGKVIVHLKLAASTTFPYGENFIANHLILKVPNGEQATPVTGSNEALYPGSPKSGMFADFEVPEPAIGHFVLIVRDQTNTAEIPFTLS